MVTVINNHPQYKLELEEWRKIAQKVLTGINQEAKNLNIILENDDEILKINKEFLEHDYVTDVISFEDVMDDPDFLGEVYICLDQAERQAPDFENTLEEEFLTLIVHGILHLTGYDDIEPEDKESMFKKQDEIVAHMKTNPLIRESKIVK